MRKFDSWRAWLGVLCAVVVAFGGSAAPAEGAADDPLFVFTAPEAVPPDGNFEGPCGLAIDVAGNFYVSDYYHHTVDLFKPTPTYLTQLANEDPADGPCGLAIDVTGRLYVNNFHRNVVRFTPSVYPPTSGTAYGTGTVIDSQEPTGVAVNTATNNVYVDDRTYVAVYGPSGAAVEEGGVPLHVGLSSLGHGYGVAVSNNVLSMGQIYVPDAASDTVKVYNPAIDKVNPVATISKPDGGFNSLRDSAVAVDSVTGDIYVADSVGSPYTEHPETAIDVFDFTGAYKGRLKFNVIDGAPVGLAVDNSTGTNQGRVYVTSGNTEQASVYAYPPGAATNVELPAAFNLGLSTSGSGEGSVTSASAGIDCSTSCRTELLAGAEIPLNATAAPGSAFLGWAGGGCSGTDTCVVGMTEARSVSAEFESLPSPALPTGAAEPEPGETPLSAAPLQAQDLAHHRAKRRHQARHRHHSMHHRRNRGHR